MNMKRLMVVCAAIAVLFVLPACGELGEDPLPGPGVVVSPSGRTYTVLYKNGTIYNFDYTAQYDGIQLNKFVPPIKDLITGVEKEGSPWTQTSAKVKGGGADPYKMDGGVNVGGEYKIRGENVMRFQHDLPNNSRVADEAWMFTLFGTVSNKVGTVTPLVGKNWNVITFWAKVAGVPPSGDEPRPVIQVAARSSSGFSYGNGTVIIEKDSKALVLKDQPNDPANDQKWYKYTVTLEDPEVAMPPTDWLREWSIGVSADAGLVYIDEVIIYQPL